MDDISNYNRERWNALVRANALFTRPALHLDATNARQRIDAEGLLGELAGKRVLCLAGGGGQQSAAFALLGAQVTVYDLSDAQLERDREAAAHYGVSIETVQGDMRDLSHFADESFDVVWHPYSINFVPEIDVVFGEVARVLCDRGLYHLHFANPFISGLTAEDWDGHGYPLKHPYVDGAEITYKDQDWVYSRSENAGEAIPAPREYRHTLSTVVNGLVARGFVIRHLSDSLGMHPDAQAEPGTWDHFNAFAPPWLAVWAWYCPGAFTM
ncbi:MAG TPA: class I SAM-dependent methyltransferase [Ktedonobacteraceae bacterium]